MCQLLGIELVPSPPRAVYEHGWGMECTMAKITRHCWYLNIFVIEGRPTTLALDLVQGNSPLIIGLDVQKYGVTQNMRKKKYFKFRRPSDNHSRIFFRILPKIETAMNDYGWISFPTQKHA